MRTIKKAVCMGQNDI